MNDEFIITPGPAPDSALNPLRANLSRLALSDEVSDEDREAIKSFLKTYRAMSDNTESNLMALALVATLSIVVFCLWVVIEIIIGQ